MSDADAREVVGGRSGRGRAWPLARAAALVALVVGAGVVALVVGVPSTQQVRASVGGWGWWAEVAYAGLYAVVTLTPLPKTVFTLAAGAVLGLAGGLPAVVAGALLGAVAAFFLGRLLGRDAVQRFTGARVDRLDDLLARRGLAAVLAARLVPVVPFTATNYLAGLTALRLRDFVVGTVVGILPATTAYVTIGAFGSEPGSWPVLASVAALVVLTLAGALVAWRRRRGRTLARPNVRS